MSLKSKLQEDLRESLKAQKTVRISTLRLLISALLNKEIDKRFQLSKKNNNPVELEKQAILSDEEIIDLIFFEVKKRKEAIEIFLKGGKTEIAQKEKDEIDILSEYLPRQLSEQEIEQIVKETAESLDINDIKAFGLLMKEVSAQVKGKADGSLVSAIVKKYLQP